MQHDFILFASNRTGSWVEQTRASINEKLFSKTGKSKGSNVTSYYLRVIVREAVSFYR